MPEDRNMYIYRGHSPTQPLSIHTTAGKCTAIAEISHTRCWTHRNMKNTQCSAQLLAFRINLHLKESSTFPSGVSKSPAPLSLPSPSLHLPHTPLQPPLSLSLLLSLLFWQTVPLKSCISTLISREPTHTQSLSPQQLQINKTLQSARTVATQRHCFFLSQWMDKVGLLHKKGWCKDGIKIQIKKGEKKIVTRTIQHEKWQVQNLDIRYSKYINMHVFVLYVHGEIKAWHKPPWGLQSL